MKKMRKLISVLLVVCVVLSMSSIVFASSSAETGKVQIAKIRDISISDSSIGTYNARVSDDEKITVNEKTIVKRIEYTFTPYSGASVNKVVTGLPILLLSR